MLCVERLRTSLTIPFSRCTKILCRVFFPYMSCLLGLKDPVYSVMVPPHLQSLEGKFLNTFTPSPVGLLRLLLS